MSRMVVFSAYGGPEMLEVVDVEPDEPGPGAIRVRVRAAGVQPFDALFRSGEAHAYVPATFPQRLGNEFAGVVDAVGDDVTGVAVGDEVIGWAMLASYAEHVVVPAGQVVRKPASMPWPEAGVLSASGQTADTALEKLRVGAGDTVLVHAAAGGVGTIAYQPAADRIGVQRLGTERSAARLARLTALYEKGDLAVRIQEAIPVEDVARAHHLIETGHTTGKLVLVF